MKTRYSRRAWAGFEALFRPWMHRRLDGVHLRGLEDTRWAPPDMPILLVANHTSWWDGFLLREVHRRLRPDAPLHVVMLERELRRVPVFRLMGAVPLSRRPLGPRRLVRDLRTRIDRRPDAVLGYFPQGRIEPSHAPVTFERGAEWLIRQLGPLAVIPVGLHLEPLTRPGPAAFVSVGPGTVARTAPSTAELQAMVNLELATILAFVRRHGEAAATRWDEGGAP